MNQKQYDAARQIMQFSRLFADAMRKIMENNGLFDLDFTLDVRVEKLSIEGLYGICEYQGDIGLVRRPTLHDDWETDYMHEMKVKGKGWVVHSDPMLNSGVVPPTVRTMETAERVYGEGKKTEKPTPPDGLWISRYDDPYPVDGE